MTDNTSSNGYFDEAGREGAPTALLKEKGHFVKGPVVDLFYIPEKDFKTKEVLKNDDGSVREQLVIVLQTESRNWDKVSKVPVGIDGSAKPADLDDGKRAVYAPKFTNIYAALGKAVKAADAKDVLIGGDFGIIVEDLVDTNKGNPLKVFRAKYDPPAKGATVVGDDPLGSIGAKSAGSSEASTPAAESPKQDKVAETPPAAAASEVEEPPF